MPGERFYKLKEWKKLRARVLARDGGLCTVPGCGREAKVVDHIHPRPKGVDKLTDLDREENLRSLCRVHDNQVKEAGDGKRRADVFGVSGGDARGWPRDPMHPWNARAVDIGEKK